ncbi:histidinol-phosphate aminotransferase family protein [bacterium]|nr:histidinol-phosphate aminotransferase family protein [bacterium]
MNSTENLFTPPQVSRKWMDQFLVPGLLDARPYKIDTTSTPVKLDQNENPWDWPDHLKEKVAGALRRIPWNRYPSAYSDDLADVVAAQAGLTPGCVLLGPGSNYLVALVMSTFSRTGQGKVVVARPSFALYESHCAYDGIPCEPWLLDDNLQYDVRLLPALTPGSMVVFASPNNPVGNVLPYLALKDLATRHPNVLFVGDEAYLEYAREPYTNLLRDHSNILLIRTFSKTLGAAGVRLGYVLGAPQLIEQLRKLRLPYMINAFGLVAARFVLEDSEAQAHFKAVVTKGIAERDRVFADLQTMAPQKAFKVIPSEANFLLLKWQDQSACDRAYRHILEQGILIRDVSSGPGLAGCLRVSIGTDEQNDRFLAAIKSL